MHYSVEITDKNAKTCGFRLSLPLIAKPDIGNSTWRTLDKGFFKYHTGGCQTGAHLDSSLFTIGNSGFFSTGDLYLYLGKTPWLVLGELFDRANLVNSSGEGAVLIPEPVINFEKDEFFAWTLIE